MAKGCAASGEGHTLLSFIASGGLDLIRAVAQPRVGGLLRFGEEVSARSGYA